MTPPTWDCSRSGVADQKSPDRRRNNKLKSDHGSGVFLADRPLQNSSQVLEFPQPPGTDRQKICHILVVPYRNFFVYYTNKNKTNLLLEYEMIVES